MTRGDQIADHLITSKATALRMSVKGARKISLDDFRNCMLNMKRVCRNN